MRRGVVLRAALAGVALAGAVLVVPAWPGVPEPAAPASCDRERGERVFTKCAICHAREAALPSPVGPNLAGVVGRQSATLAQFKYTKVLRELRQRWTPELIDRFLIDPQAFAPGTAMAFTGLKDADDRAAVICLLEHPK